MALQLKEIIAAKAKERMLSGKKLDPVQNSSQGKSRDEIAKAAGVSHDTIRKVEDIEKQAPEPIKEFARDNVISINKAY